MALRLLQESHVSMEGGGREPSDNEADTRPFSAAQGLQGKEGED